MSFARTPCLFQLSWLRLTQFFSCTGRSDFRLSCLLMQRKPKKSKVALEEAIARENAADSTKVSSGPSMSEPSMGSEGTVQ